jgi:hypothetical protein
VWRENAILGKDFGMARIVYQVKSMIDDLEFKKARWTRKRRDLTLDSQISSRNLGKCPELSGLT